QPREWTHIAYAIPGVKLARRLSLRLVTFEKPRHEKLFGEGRQTDATRLAIIDNSVGIIHVNYFNLRPRQRRVVDDRVIVFRLTRFVNGQSHQRIAISGRKV